MSLRHQTKTKSIQKTTKNHWKTSYHKVYMSGAPQVPLNPPKGLSEAFKLQMCKFLMIFGMFSFDKETHWTTSYHKIRTIAADENNPIHEKNLCHYKSHNTDFDT